eukprot:2327373-Rhodomonas_salina.1
MVAILTESLVVQNPPQTEPVAVPRRSTDRGCCRTEQQYQQRRLWYTYRSTQGLVTAVLTEAVRRTGRGDCGTEAAVLKS